MRIIELTSVDGNRIAVNVEAIATLRIPHNYERDGISVIVFVSGQTCIVRQTIDEIVTLLWSSSTSSPTLFVHM